MLVDVTPGPQAVPNLKQLEVLDAYYAWLCQLAKEQR